MSRREWGKVRSWWAVSKTPRPREENLLTRPLVSKHECGNDDGSGIVPIHDQAAVKAVVLGDRQLQMRLIDSALTNGCPRKLLSHSGGNSVHYHRNEGCLTKVFVPTHLSLIERAILNSKIPLNKPSLTKRIWCGRKRPSRTCEYFPQVSIWVGFAWHKI